MWSIKISCIHVKSRAFWNVPLPFFFPEMIISEKLTYSQLVGRQAGDVFGQPDNLSYRERVVPWTPLTVAQLDSFHHISRPVPNLASRKIICVPGRMILTVVSLPWILICQLQMWHHATFAIGILLGTFPIIDNTGFDMISNTVSLNIWNLPNPSAASTNLGGMTPENWSHRCCTHADLAQFPRW